MSEPTPEQQELLSKRISEGTQALAARTRQLRRSNAGLVISGVVSSGVSTLITGMTAAQGPIVGTGTEGWRLACAVAAVFSFGTTVALGLNQHLKITERLAETRQCAGRLRALEVGLATSTRDWHAIAKEYGELMRTYPEVMT